jgi:hypothetical protein
MERPTAWMMPVDKVLQLIDIINFSDLIPRHFLSQNDKIIILK